ncbi:echinoidin-like [Haliotis asinina]|uniref:echinoidin-like n=1 Tax=Haliotis asinina TaxID=109174 RepID=UPI0035322797
MDTLKCIPVIFRIVIGVFLISEASSSACPSGWTSNGTNCYFFSSFETNWHSANNDCQQRGAHLASIHSESENTYISSFNSSMYIWIGYNDLTEEGSFRWTDGSALDFSNWGSDQPDDLGNEDCVGTNFLAFGAWNDFYCSRFYRYICVKKGSASTSTAATIPPTSKTWTTPAVTSLITVLTEKDS